LLRFENLQKEFYTTIEEGLKVLERVYWLIKVKQSKGTWNVYAGEALIFSTDSQEALSAFLYGLALTYVSMDQSIFESIRNEIKKWIE
jgi:hypothetical protein